MRMIRGLLLSLIAVGLLCLSVIDTQPALGEDGAHGGGSNSDKPQPTEARTSGPAVKAPRTTERYTEKGVTVDPVAIDIAPNGDIYVAEGARAGISAIDNRNAGLRKSNGVINDLQKTSVEDRLKQINMLIEGGFYPKDTFTKATDRVRLVKDTDGDGKADTSSIFADGFNDPLDGIAAGVLYHDGKVYLTNIPHVWLLQDRDGDGDADKETPGERVSLSYGWGIRWAFYGHDMHGLIKGPDGRIYWSIGDRSFNVTTKEGKHLYYPDRGAVLRMWPDGSGLEVFFEGLRNPQELAFDNYGNLFTGDNNSDSGDKARFIYLPEGGDCGWRQDVQSLRDRGPWNREFMWYPRDVEKYGLDQPAWIIPPLANVGRGPSGLTHYPGTGDVFPKNGSFLLCDYPSGVRHVLIKPDGAMFKVVEDSLFPTQGKTITDVTWGYDGRLYLSDWGGGWKPNPNGYIKTMVNKAAHREQAKQIAEVKQLFAEGFKKLSDEKLIELLGHTDQRVRLNAQWELAGRASSAESVGLVIRSDTSTELEKLHAVWTLGMQLRHNVGSISDVFTALNDSSPNVRAQAITIVGEIGQNRAQKAFTPKVLPLLDDSSPIVQHHAAIALGKVGTSQDIAPLLDLLDRNNNDDVAVRHGASYGLSLIGDADKIASEMKRRGPAARLGGVLALRRLDSPFLADFLADEDPVVAAEAARAIYDKHIMAAMPALAALSDTLPADRMSEPVMRRVIEANLRLADQDSAARLARLAAHPDAPEPWRLLALKELDQWSAERNREGVWGAWWPRPKQTMDHAIAALLIHLPAIKANAKGAVLKQARLLEQKHILKAGPDQLITMARKKDEQDAMRIAAMQLLAEKNKAKAVPLAEEIAGGDENSVALRQSMRRLLQMLDKTAASRAYLAALESGETAEQQEAIGVLARDKSDAAQQALTQLAKQLKDGTLAPELRLDVFEAVSKARHLPDDARLAASQYADQNQLPGEEPLIRDTLLAGGSAERGKELFLYHSDAQCIRCHGNPEEPDAAMIGPWLGSAGATHDLAYLYYAVTKPSKDIAKGYANSMVTLKDGQIKTGRVNKQKSDAKTLILVNSDGAEEKIDRTQIDGSVATSDQSQMLAMTDTLKPTELRDVIAYLATLKQAPSGTTGGTALAGYAGSAITKPAAMISHAVVLPVVLLVIGAGLALILIGTMLGGPRVSAE